MGIRAHAVVFAVALAASAVVVFADAPAEGKSAYDSPYGYDKTWNATLRLVRVDMGMKILEKDDANGYLLFEYRSSEAGPKTTNGSIEFIRAASTKSENVMVVVQLPQMPRYHEQVLLDHLSKKMRDEYGDPPEPRINPASAPDAGADGGESY